jgi:hypothetical protein
MSRDFVWGEVLLLKYHYQHLKAKAFGEESTYTNYDETASICHSGGAV